MGRLLTETEAAAYQKLIDRYEPSQQTIEDFARSNFAVIAGPTGAGKDTLRNALISNSRRFARVLSTTSRPPRPGEQDGVHYHYRPLEFFEEGFKERRFLQAAVVHNQQISCLDIKDIHALNRQIGLSILIVQTEVDLRSLNPQMKTIFLTPPDLNTLLARMKAGREAGQDEINRRLSAAKAELQIALSQPNYYCVVNDSIERMVDLARRFLLEHEVNKEEDAQARRTIEELLGQLQAL
jgi:guanylate kinase